MKKLANVLKSLIILILIPISLFSQKDVNELSLMPMPENIELNAGKFVLDKNFTIVLNSNEKKLFDAAYRSIKIITDRSGLFLLNQFPIIAPEIKGKGIIINVGEDVKLELGIDESYQLVVSSDNIRIDAPNTFGAMHGLSTLVQLLDSDEGGYYFPCVKVKDKPRFVWRGLMIDISRHFEPIEVMKRNIDAMAAVKLNVLHWHLTDDHGFRIETKSLPKLHELGSDGLYYTHEQIKDVVNYAYERGIRVVPEFDLPGHATAWLVGYPELASAPGPYEIERLWGIFNPTFDPTNEDVYKFFETFFKEMTELFPDRYWHLGGDENNGKQWNANPKIQEFMKANNLKDNHALQNYFNVRLDNILKKLNKTMVGWYTDEMPDLEKDYIVQAWKGRTTLYETAKKGYRSLLSHGFYIDLVQSTEYHYKNDPIPPDSILSNEVKERILGGEATMWAEFAGPETIDSRIWPRTAAIAERLWSPGSVNDLNNMFLRLDQVSLQLETYGLTHIKNYDMMLRRIVNNYDIEVLKNFVNAVKPLYTYSRDRPHIFKSYYPLTRIVDAALPDPRSGRLFNYSVDELLANETIDNDNYEKVKSCLKIWKDNHEQLLPLINSKPILKEVAPLSEDLSKVSAIGLESLELIKENKKADSVWIAASNEIIKAAAVPKGEIELAILSSIQKLFAKVNK
ncbi:MAG: family 20 glycosylhydrolase [Ignavibacteriaceae bacterium]|jgi:hexosaminidase|nr:family 20 glycosylhydrolase [Ignavibacteriaceae bacterium]